MILYLSRAKKEFIADLPIGKLWGVGKKTESVLHEMGILSIGDLARMDNDLIYFRLKNHGLHLKKLSLGMDERSVESHAFRKSISEETTFQEDTCDKDFLYRTIRILSDVLSDRLSQENLAGYTLTLKIRREDFRTFTRSRTFKNSLFLSEDIYLYAADLFSGFYSGNDRLRLLGISLSGLTEKNSSIQPDLFLQESQKKKDDMESVIRDMKNKYGSKVKKGMYFS